MKKIFGVLFALFLAFAPFAKVFAADLEKIDLNNYETMNLVETLESEEIELSYKDYKESDDQVTIYLFRGQGCGYCKAFLTFLNSISKEYGKYFKVVSFETWTSKENSKLLETLSGFMDNDARGVPFIIIGDQVFPGYAADFDEGIISTIQTQYESDNKFDVVAEYNKYVEEELKKDSKDKVDIILWNAVISLLIGGVVMLHVSASNKKMLRIMGYSLKEELLIEDVEIEDVEEDIEEDEEIEEEDIEEEDIDEEEIDEEDIEEDEEIEEEVEEEIEEEVEEEPEKVVYKSKQSSRKSKKNRRK